MDYITHRYGIDACRPIYCNKWIFRQSYVLEVTPMLDIFFDERQIEAYRITFVLIVIVIICAWFEVGHAQKSIVSMSPHAQAVEALMADWESQGYKVARLDWGKPDLNNGGNYLIAYEVTDTASGEFWIYTWTLKIPTTPFTTDEEREEIMRHPETWELIPVTLAAELIHDNLAWYMPEWYTKVVDENYGPEPSLQVLGPD